MKEHQIMLNATEDVKEFGSETAFQQASATALQETEGASAF